MRNYQTISAEPLAKEFYKDLELTFDFDPIQEVGEICQEIHKDQLKQVPLKLRFHGFEYAQVCRTERTALYHQTYDGITVGYEVFVIQMEPESFVYDTFYPTHERWPRDRDWGKTAWSCFTLEEAILKYNKLKV
jgi:hypothetical protein